MVVTCSKVTFWYVPTCGHVAFDAVAQTAVCMQVCVPGSLFKPHHVQQHMQTYSMSDTDVPVCVCLCVCTLCMCVLCPCVSVCVCSVCRQMFGDAALGQTNLDMIATARSVGAAAKFTGSGGAIVALCPQGDEQEQQLQGACCCVSLGLFSGYVAGCFQV